MTRDSATQLAKFTWHTAEHPWPPMPPLLPAGAADQFRSEGWITLPSFLSPSNLALLRTACGELIGEVRPWVPVERIRMRHAGTRAAIRIAPDGTPWARGPRHHAQAQCMGALVCGETVDSKLCMMSTGGLYKCT